MIFITALPFWSFCRVNSVNIHSLLLSVLLYQSHNDQLLILNLYNDLDNRDDIINDRKENRLNIGISRKNNQIERIDGMKYGKWIVK